MKKFLIPLSLLAFISPLHAQKTNTGADPFKDEPNRPYNPETDDPKNISICYEAFSLPLADAAKLQRQKLTDSELYAKIVTAVENESAKQESFTVLRCRSGQKATNQAVKEYIYPTAWSPAGNLIKQYNPRSNSATTEPETITTSASAYAFETRNTGLTLECEPTLGADNRWIDISLATNYTLLSGHSTWGQNEATVKKPEFEAQIIYTGITLQANKPHLLGTINRPPVSKIDPDSANTVWFAFITGSISKY